MSAEQGEGEREGQPGGRWLALMETQGVSERRVIQPGPETRAAKVVVAVSRQGVGTLVGWGSGGSSGQVWRGKGLPALPPGKCWGHSQRQEGRFSWQVGGVSRGPWQRAGLRLSLWESSLHDILEAGVPDEATQSRPRGLPLSA